MNHNFNVDIAIKYGVETAILIENIAFWIKKNKANNNNFYDGHYWTFNSAKAFSELFPYWSHFKLQRLLVQLEEKQLIKSGNYNKLNYDRTKWYAIVEESILQIYKIHNAELHNGKCNIAQPIPDINTDINTDKNIRGSRLSNDWEAPREYILFCNTERPDLDANIIANIFKDYWISVAGAKGVKSDWFATWRNWVRRQEQGKSKFKNKSAVMSDSQFDDWLNSTTKAMYHERLA